MASADVVDRRLLAMDDAQYARPGEIDALMRRFFEQDREGGLDDGLAAMASRPHREVDVACELLERASQAFDLLMNRCQRLEGDLDEVNERLRVQETEQADAIERWKRLASGFKAQVETAEQATAALKARCDAAESRVATAEHRAAALERTSARAARHAAMAESLSTKLHDKVVSAFGVGSRAHPVLKAVATRMAAE